MSTLFLYSYDTCGVCFIFQTWGSGRSMWGRISHCSVSLHPGSVLQPPHHWWGSVSTSWGEWDRSLIKIASFKALRARLQWLRQIALSCRQVKAHLWLRGQVISSQQQECCFRKANAGESFNQRRLRVLWPILQSHHLIFLIRGVSDGENSSMSFILTLYTV